MKLTLSIKIGSEGTLTFNDVAKGLSRVVNLMESEFEDQPIEGTKFMIVMDELEILTVINVGQWVIE